MDSPVLSQLSEQLHPESVEDALRRSLKDLQDLKFALDESAIVAATDQKGVIQYVNDKFIQISGYTREELIGQDHRLINSGYHPKPYIRQLWVTIANGKVWCGDLRNRAKDGSVYWVYTTIVPFLNEHKKPYLYLSIRFDITERKRAEEALEETVRTLAHMTEQERQRAEDLRQAHDRLREEQSKVLQAEKLSSIGLLAAGVAHEINNPLAGIMSCVKALEDGKLSPERRVEYFAAVREGLGRIGKITNSLVNYARPTPALGVVDAADLFDSSLPLLAATARKKQVSLASEIDRGRHFIRGDRSQLMQGLINVLLNAIYVSPAGEAVSLSAERRGDRVVIAVADRGGGMSEEVRARVFDPFFSTKPQGEGTGLGLSVTLGIINAHGGEIEIESAAGVGTIIRFVLPAA